MKNSIKKLIAIALCAVLVFSFAACSGSNDTPATDETTTLAGAADGKQLKIGIIQYMSHASLDNCYNGIISALEKSGLNYTVDRQIGSNASADADCASYAKTMVAQKYDLIYAIATPAATAAYAATDGTEIPVIFCAVSDPVAAKLVESMEKPGGLCTGTSDVLDLDAQVDLIQAMQPDVKSIGILYTTSEPNSITQLSTLKDICDKRGLTVESTGVQNDADIPAAASALAAKVDCINNFTDNMVVNNLPLVLEAAKAENIPVYGSEVEQVKKGCLAAASIDYVALGEVTGQMGIDVLGGADITTMAIKTISEATPIINTEVLESLKIEMPSAYSEAETVTAITAE
ncbi:MAG: ABC transporter substrate-binding protein [Faecalibacterium sp.]|nr:ABC transporter substrate-binding protein [Ruminococcus sp.]MCM1391639.1 ABC transporter substrate-binding protein [Ruminococcus sp.]MCM1485752.1 ABC transporter substrate-binding protein [Faecalibacterium sp.]